jgi:hypothetical protein
MQIEITRHALDRVPLSLNIDDSTVLVNANYFWMRDRNLVDGQNRRWQDVPVVHPESFTREFFEWCRSQGVRGKFSVVPCPAALGRIDEGLPLFSRAQQESWLRMCRELIVPAFDITPEMITHSVVVDPATCKPVPSGIWEQYDWARLPEDQEELVTEYIATACRILHNVGLTPQGVTSPGGFGGRNLPFYARVAGVAVRAVTGRSTPFFFQQVAANGAVATPVWYADRAAGSAVGEIVASTGDWTGSWTGYGEVDPDKYITPDLADGRAPELIAAGDPVIFCSHWQGFYGLHDTDRRGFRTFRTVVDRLRALDPRGEKTRWRTCSEIADYACARELATWRVEGDTIRLELPLQVPELTLRLHGLAAAGIEVDGRPLARASSRAAFRDGTYLVEGEMTLAAFAPTAATTTLRLRR